MAFIAPHASHMPATPAPWYAHAAVPGGGAPRTPAFNAPGAGKHWVISELEPLSADMIVGVDAIYTQRLRSLLSVDDIVAEVVDLLTATGHLNNTYFFYTSDHGYNLGVRRPPHGGGVCSVVPRLANSAQTFRLSVEKFHHLEVSPAC